MTIKQSGQLRKTVKHTAIYAVGTVIRRLTGLIMLPIYTRYLTPSDYGAVELLAMAIEVAGILIGLRIAQAMFRYYILADDDATKRRVVSTVMMTVMMSSTVGVLVLLMASEQLTVVIFGNTEFLYEFRLFALTLFVNAVIAVGLSYIRAKQMPLLFVSISISSLVLQVCLNIVFVVIYELHVTGVVYGALIGGVIIATCLSIYVFASTGFHYSTRMAGELIKYVAPLMLASLGAFYVAYADKYFLRLFVGLSEVGLYALASRVVSVLAIVFEAFNMTWGADRFEIVRKPDAKVIYEQMFRFLSAVIIICGSAIALFVDDLLRILTSPGFYLAGEVVPILVLAYLFGIFRIYCNFGALYQDKTSIIAHASWVKAIFATLGYVVLIPVFGIFGAAVTLMLSNFIEFVWIHRQSRKLYDMELRWMPIVMMLCVSLLLVALGLMMPVGEVGYFGARLLLFAALLWLIYILPIWKEDEMSAMRALITKVIRPR